MKLHLTALLFRSILSCMGTAVFLTLTTGSSSCHAAIEVISISAEDYLALSDDDKEDYIGRIVKWYKQGDPKACSGIRYHDQQEIYRGGLCYVQGGASFTITNGSYSNGTFAPVYVQDGSHAVFKGSYLTLTDGNGWGIYNYGGSIKVNVSDSVVISGNEGGIFNFTDAIFELSDCKIVTFIDNFGKGNYGGAICNFGRFTLNGNGNVTFSGNTTSRWGGAIHNDGSNATFTLSDKGNVTFSGNSVSSDFAEGGAIYNDGTFTLSDNGNVTFSGNSASSDNSAYNSAYGGAIRNYTNAATFTLSSNETVTFSGNTASCGGAIDNGGGNATFTLSDNGNVTFSGNSASYGGAIYNVGNATFTLSDNGNVTFSGNTTFSYKYYSYGGAIYNVGNATFTLSDNGNVTFSGNTTFSYKNSYGGAISNVRSNATFTPTFTLSSNETVTFSGNSASSSSSCAYGGAIYNDGTFTLSGNGNVLFEKNVADTNGNAIYGTSESDISILRNEKVHFIDNSSSDATAAAVYTDGTLTIEDNAEVIFRNNGMAFHADTANIGTTSDSESRVRIFESFDVTTLNLNRNSAKGDICLSGKNAVGEVKETATLFSGVLALSDGAVMNIGQDMEISSVSALIVLNQGTRLNVGGNLTLGGASYLQFQLDRASGNVTPLISVQNDISFSASPIKILWQDEQTLPISSDRYALIEVGKSFTYDNCTYTYENAVWKKGETEMSLSEMNLLFPEQNNLSYFWNGNVLYVQDSRISSDHIWVKTGKTWRGDELQPYNTKKRYIQTSHADTGDMYKCWVVSASNVAQYWQDQYAPLYGGDYLVTARSRNADKSAVELYAYFDKYTENNSAGGHAQNILKWWFTDASYALSFKTFWIEKPWWKVWKNVEWYEDLGLYNGITSTTNAASWSHLKFDYPSLRVDRTTDICAFLHTNLDSGESPLLLDYAIYNDGKFQNNHVVTLWGADFTYDDLGNEILKTLYVTDSDNSRGITPRDITYIDGSAYYSYQDADNYREIIRLSGINCTDNVDAMMEDYNNLKNALQWTGKAKESKWVTLSANDTDGVHLAEPSDGWKKACTGSGKTIYAHAYFTNENASNCHFEFGDSVGGQIVTNKNVVLGQALHVGSMKVSGTGYVFSGQQTLTADMLTITHGADLQLRDGVCIGQGTVVNIDGTLRVEEGSKIMKSDINMSSTGSLWGELLALTYAGSTSKDIVRLDFGDYQCVSSDVRLSGCTIGNSGTLGCTIDMQGTTTGVAFSADSLKKLVYNKLGKNNELMGKWDDYRYDFVIKKGVLNASYDDIKKQPVALSDSSLTVDAKDNSWVTVASYTGAPDLAGTDINLSETSRTEVTAPQLVTAPEAAVLLNEQSVLNTKSFIVTANSSFRNEGTLQTLDGKGTVTVEKDATLSGSGTFSSVVSSGTLVVGSSPGAPQYESLTLNTGSTTVFYLDGATPATSAEKGWGQGLHSVMSVSGDLVMEEGALITLGCSADFLNGVNIGESVTLTLIRSEQSLSDSLLPLLQTGTAIRFADTDDTLTDLADYGIVVRDQTWSFNADNTQASISLNFVSGTAGAVLFQGGSETVSWSDIGAEQESGSSYTDDTPVSFYQGGRVELNSEIQPGDMVVSAKEELTWSGEGGLKGSATLLKEDEGRLVLDISSPNYEGSVIITGGVLETRRADALGAGKVSLYGATLQTPAAHLNSLEMADDVTLLGGGTASNIFLYDETSVHAEDGFTLADSGSLFLAGKADWMGDLTLSDASLVFSAGELSVTGTLTLSGDCELSLGDYAETGRYQLILCDNLSGDWESLAVSQRDDSFIYELVQEEKGLSLVVSSKEPNMYWGFAKGIWREGARFGIGSEGEELLFSTGTNVGFNGKAQVTISGKVFPHAVTVDSAAAVKFTADKKTAGSGIAGEAVLTKSGSGVLKLNAGNTYSGGTVLNEGTIKATAADSFGTGAVTVNGGTLDLASKAVANNITVNGAAVLKGAAKYAGNELAINGDLLKGTSVTAARTDQRIAIGGECSTITGTVKSAGLVEVNGTLNATAAKLTAAQLKLNGGVFTNTKGIKVAKNQTLTLAGGSLNTGLKALTTAAGSTLKVEKSATLSGALTLGGGALVLEDGAELSISGTLTLSKATALTLDGTAMLTFGTLKAPKKGTLESFFGVGDDVTITQEGNTLVFNSPELTACAAPAAAEPETVAAPAPALAPAVAPAVAELAKKAAAARPLGDALVMADWAIVDANRAFTGTLQSRRDSGVVLADGQGMAWASAMDGVSRHGSENGHNGADVNMSGAAVGVEHTAGKNSTLGLAVGHTWSRIGATGMQHLRQDTAHVALYGQTKLPHGFTAEWSAAYGDTDSKGTFNGTRETWSQKSTAISARLNKTHELTDSTAVRGFAGLNYDATDAASIHGMHTGSIQRLQGEVGAGITHRADKLTTYAEASVTTDLARNAPAVDFGTWRQNGATPGRTGFNLTLGAAYELTDKWSINAAYHVEAAERATQHSFNVGAGMKF